MKNDIDLKEFIENETGKKFDKNGKIHCPFTSHGGEDKNPSFSVTFKNSKWVWRCFTEEKGGDIFDFLKEYKGLEYIAACEYLGLKSDNKKVKLINIKNKIIETALKNNKECIFKNIYAFTDEKGSILYYKVKLIKKNGSKITPYYHVEGNKIISKRPCDEVPYNLYNVVKASNEGRIIFVVEGEKDADSLNSLGFTATSCKNLMNFDVFKNSKIYFCGDNDLAGEKYAQMIINNIAPIADEFKIIELPGIENIEKGDVTDWLNEGHTKEEFKAAAKQAWDYKKSSKWKYVKKARRNGEEVLVPLKVWENLELCLKRNQIKLKYNLISKEVECEGLITSSRNELLTDIYSLEQREGLNMSRDEVFNSIQKIALKNKYNPFIDWLKKNKNEEFYLINEVFSCIEIAEDSKANTDKYYKYFRRWALNVVKMAHNTLDKQYVFQGVLVLQAPQGRRKSTFFRCILPNNKWFKGDKTLNPDKTDSVKENTKYILVEWGELDSTLKAEQAKLKQFITSPSDEYRIPYARVEEIYPRITSYCASVNDRDFLKDKSGSRRFWVIPSERCDIDKLSKTDISKFWGCIYTLWLLGEQDWLSEEETMELNKDNLEFAAETETSITLDEAIDWNSKNFSVYTITELVELLGLEKKALKNELEKRGIKAGTQRIGKDVSWGYKLPKVKPVAQRLYGYMQQAR